MGETMAAPLVLLADLRDTLYNSVVDESEATGVLIHL